MKEVIEALMAKAGDSHDACQALQFSQAALNVSNANRVRADMPKSAVLRPDQLMYMANRFLGWKLPEDFAPDCGISFKKTFNDHLTPPSKYEPQGTNLFAATQVDAMVRYMIDGLPD